MSERHDPTHPGPLPPGEASNPNHSRDFETQIPLTSLHDYFMASGSLHRKKANKRPNLQPYTPMASGPNPSSKLKSPYLIFSGLFILSVLAFLGISLNMQSKLIPGDLLPKIYTIEVVNEFPHDSNAFTQGILYAGNGTIFESTGLYGKSSVRKVNLQTGKVEVLQKLDVSYFGEGLTLLGERIVVHLKSNNADPVISTFLYRLFQVTWLKNTGFIYDRNNLSKFEKFTHQMQDGWGLATDGKVLFGSDGTSALYLIDPQTYEGIGKRVVTFNGHEVHNLNELEFINREVWANVWQTDCIARISPEDGAVVGWVLMPNLREKLLAAGNYGIDVLNGIAWDGEKKRIFVTGKLWPKLYEIKLHPAKKQIKSGVIEQLCLRMPAHFAKP
ncbi:Glutaminyl-peptide cyclotransferase [Morella rubra]|uniref:Glutaminyl-peptide cyclotransferase n=1 Tax=Morella rubra TaxID=262757 RepID=A0A6A1W4E0_9ROSI|nr:Glutaminyl-peptide cyclotransferase [Morella rubra]KAB1220104.1 Glutaminyl-peptide cyclotransferase [Morella rubra]